MSQFFLIFPLLLLFFAPYTLSVSRIIRSGSGLETPQETFHAPLYAADITGARLFIGLKKQSPDDHINEFALSYIRLSDKALLPFTPKNTFLQCEKDDENPLFNQSIKHLALMEGSSKAFHETVHPIVVTEQHPYLVHLVSQYRGKPTVLTIAQYLQDATQDYTHYTFTPEITALGASIDLHGGTYNGQIFAAVKPYNGKKFGEIGTGIAMIIFGSIVVKEDETSEKKEDQDPTQEAIKVVFHQCDHQKGGKTIADAQVAKAAPFDITSSFLSLADNPSETPLSFIDEHVVLLWNRHLNRLFIGATLMGAPDQKTGVCALTVAHTTLEKGIRFYPIAPKSAFNEHTNSLIGKMGANAYIGIKKLAMMHTSTSLDYLIALGKNNPDEAPIVCAFGLVTSAQEFSSGVIASTLTSPTPVFDDRGKFVRRLFSKAAEKPQELPQNNNPSVFVGGSPLPESGTISELTCAGDLVFVTMTDPDQQYSGIFCSRALFNCDGAIKGWTQWQRAIPTTENVTGVVLNRDNQTLTFLARKDNGLISIEQTEWYKNNKENIPLTTMLNKLFPSEQRGINCVHDFPYATPGLGPISMLAVGGFGSLALVQTGSRHNGYGLPEQYQTIDQVKRTKLGRIDNEVLTKIHFITGGTLTKLGLITDIAVASDDNGQSFLVVGGQYGLALLQDKQGEGWKTAAGIGEAFCNIKDGSVFKQIGSYQGIKKLIADGPYLYILTHTTCSRLDMRTIQQTDSATILAQATNNESFFDIIVSGPFALLATNNGLLRVGNNGDIRTAYNVKELNWTSVPVPACVGSIVQLEAISSTGLETEITAGCGGMVYALDLNRATHQTHLVRFSVEGLTDNQSINNHTITAINDSAKKDTPSYTLNFGTTRTKMATNGISYVCSSNGTSSCPQPVLIFGTHSICPGIGCCGRMDRAKQIKEVPIALPLYGSIQKIGVISAWGSWFAAGNFGIQIHH